MSRFLASKTLRSVGRKLLTTPILLFARFAGGRKFLLWSTKLYTVRNDTDETSVWLFEYILRVGGVTSSDYLQHTQMETGVWMDLDIREVDQRKLFFFGRAEAEVTRIMRRLLSVGGTFVDVGANVGYHTLTAAKIVGSSGAVLAVEPNPSVRSRLEHNVSINGFNGNVTLLPCAVGECSGELILYPAKSNISGITSRFCYSELLNPEGIQVEMKTLDELVDSSGLTKVDLIKIDIEGGELSALEGATRVIDRFAPDFIAEVSTFILSRAKMDATTIFNFMGTRGYKAYLIDPSGVTAVTADCTPSLPPVANILFTQRGIVDC